MAVVHDKVTAIGGYNSDGVVTNSLHCLTSGEIWEEVYPPMSTKRVSAAAVTAPNHLVVAGGRSDRYTVRDLLRGVEILDLDSLQWSSASSLPTALQYPHMTLCGEHLYLSEQKTVFTCSVDQLLKSCKPVYVSTNSNDSGSVWIKLPKIPVRHWASLTTLRGQVLAVGGSNKYVGGTPTGAIHHYNGNTSSWSLIGEMPTPRYETLVAVLPSNELIVVGGLDATGWPCNITEIASTD